MEILDIQLLERDKVEIKFSEPETLDHVLTITISEDCVWQINDFCGKWLSLQAQNNGNKEKMLRWNKR